MTLAGIGAGLAGLWIGLRYSRRFRRVGVLRYTSSALDFEFGNVRRHLHLSQPYELEEGLAFGLKNMPLQVVIITQNSECWGFSYGLPMWRKPYGDKTLDEYLTPLLAGETRIIHDRLRQRIEQTAKS
jgi:hypothetical protein